MVDQEKDHIRAIHLLKKNPFDPRELGLAAEAMAYKLSFKPMFYADLYGLGDQFWGLHDRNKYDELRREWGGETAYPDIYTKIHLGAGDIHLKPRKLSGLLNYARDYYARGPRKF